MKRFTLAALVAGGAALGAASGDPEKGNEIFDEQCAACHNAYTEERKKGPGLKFLFVRDKLESTGKPPTEAAVLDKIDKGGKGMPPFKGSFSETDRADLLAYPKTL